MIIIAIAKCQAMISVQNDRAYMVSDGLSYFLGVQDF